MGRTLGELAAQFGCELRGDAATRVTGVATLANAGPNQLGFLANPHYRVQLATTRAGAVVLDVESASLARVPVLVSRNPHADYARIAALLHPPAPLRPGVHRGAMVDPSAHLDASAEVAAGAIVEAEARVGPRSFIGPGAVIGRGATVGADCRLHARVSIGYGVELAERVTVHAGAVIGADGFGFARDGEVWVRVPQLGSVRIGADVDIGANTTVDRGAIEDTVIEEGVKIDNLVQVAHNVRIGAHTIIAACVGISGSTTIGRRCLIGGKVGIAGHLTLCDDVAVTGCSMISHSIRVPGVYSGGIPAEPARLWRRLVGGWKRGARGRGSQRTG